MVAVDRAPRYRVLLGLENSTLQAGARKGVSRPERVPDVRAGTYTRGGQAEVEQGIYARAGPLSWSRASRKAMRMEAVTPQIR